MRGSRRRDAAGQAIAWVTFGTACLVAAGCQPVEDAGEDPAAAAATDGPAGDGAVTLVLDADPRIDRDLGPEARELWERFAGGE